MIVVSNTSPLTNLAAIDQFHLLQSLYQRLWIPVAVWNELNAYGIEWPGSLQTRQATWIIRQNTSNQPLVKTLQQDLDQGEAEAIALAVELNADLLLIDEKEGRRAAKRLGLNVSGVIGILVEAKLQARIHSIKHPLDRLRNDAGFFINERLHTLALHLAGEEM